MVSLSLVQVGIFAFLACLCAAIYAGLRNQSSLAWLAAALFCGAIGMLIVGQAGGSLSEWATITIAVPAAYLCVGQSVRIILGQRSQYRALIGTVLALTAVALLMAFADVPFLYQTLPFQLACALAVSESVIRLVRAPQRHVVDICLIVALSGLAAVFLVRIPLFLILFEPGSHYAVVKASPFQRVSLVISGILTPLTAFLLMVKVIGGVIATYRMRSERDGLTGLLNRQSFDLAVARDRRAGGFVIMCDIDHFKQVNDRYGHAVGDDVLRAFASLLETTGHSAGRMGGEEFALLVPVRNAAEAASVAEMIRQRFHAGSPPGIAPDHRLSASFGVARYWSGADPKTVFVRADAALYRAKEAGRNRVVVAEDRDVPGVDRLRAA
ncbi:MAG TPA: GGDEF domain-containing protein [Sphingomonas sp.]|uniref:GGDEF domain-containing protein n=1 Tax=Sphingomonas sp. TaxID=28214 RepID=UPI002B56249D|nr:GGDEF domain-containing protein [Sphingomonas sp.]HMI19545.1 GGDEF domain-containing protein [Sphingomonas sp.]